MATSSDWRSFERGLESRQRLAISFQLLLLVDGMFSVGLAPFFASQVS